MSPGARRQSGRVRADRELTEAVTTAPPARRLIRLVYAATEEPHGVRQRLLALALRGQALLLDTGLGPRGRGDLDEMRRGADDLRRVMDAAHGSGLIDRESYDSIGAALAVLEEELRLPCPGWRRDACGPPRESRNGKEGVVWRKGHWYNGPTNLPRGVIGATGLRGGEGCCFRARPRPT